MEKLDVTYQLAFTASEKISREARIATRNRVKQEKPSPVVSPVASSYESPMTDRYWKKQKTILTERMVGKKTGLITESLKILTERMIGANKDIILKAVSLLEHVDEEDHARTLETLIHKYNGHDDNYELLGSICCDKFRKELEDIDLDRKPTSKGRTIKHTPLMTHQLELSMWTQSA